ncbi:hypothetical protein GUJ93_ZPchr0337g7085 [Zizania palustris]|uniref:Uncharacterized protein n=1 Tax=Zizania palustris TaxID=103762 RepID=A0A8J5V0T3_ZIZPA|nr:hypothetical protein GUJ93_ZPchr0337g7085 [Zizania palustris]
MTNNPTKFIGLKGYGVLAVVGRVPVISPITKENQKYLETKRTKMGHVYGSDLPGNLPVEFLDPDCRRSFKKRARAFGASPSTQLAPSRIPTLPEPPIDGPDRPRPYVLDPSPPP